DPHSDTPGEILHTYLLGNDKYVWHDTTKNWDDKKGDIFASRLQGSSINGLSIPPPRPQYVVQYKNSLIGKHFKMLQQLGVFHLHDLCAPLVFDLWKATGDAIQGTRRVTLWPSRALFYLATFYRLDS
ncbi:hypothetical protein B0H13DRAFT_1618370, partial [Mycena leptocephala]